METGTLRTIPFKGVYEQIVSRLGLDPSQAVPHNLWQAIPRNLNKWLRNAWTYWEWPYLEQCDERAYARTWLADHQFQGGETVIYVPDLNYYRANTAPPIGSSPGSTDDWALVTDHGNVIAFDQICRRPMGMVLGVYKGDPRTHHHGSNGHGLNYRPQQNGIAVCGGSGPTVFVKYQVPTPRFTLTPYAPGRHYNTGDLVYDSVTGECYIAVAPSQDVAPPDPTAWLRQNFPEFLEDYIVAATYASCLKEVEQSQVDPAVQQMRMMWAKDAQSEAEDALVGEIDQLKAMGQRFHYRSWKSCAHAMHTPGVCASEPWIPPEAGMTPPVTTLQEICESDPTSYPAAPDPPGTAAEIELVSGTKQLVNGQSYIDVGFLVAQASANWLFVECRVLNTVDASPLNIWPGIITQKTGTGFRLQLNGLPDSSNYYLQWAIKSVGELPPGTDATTYSLSGPSSGTVGVPSADFTVALPGGATVPAPVTVTPSDGGGGGTFTPASVTLNTATPSATFKYTPASTGAKTISLTNNGALSDPPSRTYTSNLDTAATTYTLTGPASGLVSVASTDFTVALPAGSTVAAPVTVTPGDGGVGTTGTFTPSTVILTTAAPSATFKYTPGSTGAKTVHTNNNRGLTDPAPLTYTATSPGMADGGPVSSWADSSGNGHHATMTGSNRPIFKTAIIGGKPVVRFSTAGASKLTLASSVPNTGLWLMFAVMKATGPTVALYTLASSAGSPAPGRLGILENSDGRVYWFSQDTVFSVATTTYSSAFHILMARYDGANNGNLRVDGTSDATTSGAATTYAGIFDSLGWGGAGSAYSDGDIAEIIFYSQGAGIMNGTDRANIEAYLGAKYGIAVTSGGTAVDPTTVTGLMAWWKADSGVS
jgi:hypothetical protein